MPALVHMLLSSRGTVSGRTFAVSGVVLFFIKWNLDRWIGSDLVRSSWPWTFMFPAVSLDALGPEQRRVLLWIALNALPFVYCGVVLTAKRLRALSMSQRWVLLFFVPVVNLLFFLGLCFARPSGSQSLAQSGSFAPRWLPRSHWGRASLAVAIWFPIALVCMFVLQDFGWGLFLGIPFALGFMASVFERLNGSERPVLSGVLTALKALALVFGALFLLAMEGVVCIAMAAPVAAPVCVLGALLGGMPVPAGRGCLGVLAGTTLFVGFEHVVEPKPPTYAVVSFIDVDAAPEHVWAEVIAFSELSPVTDWVFKTGIAYPVRAEIQGAGVGAIRHCVFSTGPFVEPVTVWDAPRELRFGVTEQPPPMQSWTFYKFLPLRKKVTFHSEEGRFLLRRLPDGGTRLQGTTWYHNDLQPAGYWKLWSDFLIHRIHMRVLRHVKAEVEAE